MIQALKGEHSEEPSRGVLIFDFTLNLGSKEHFPGFLQRFNRNGASFFLFLKFVASRFQKKILEVESIRGLRLAGCLFAANGLLKKRLKSGMLFSLAKKLLPDWGLCLCSIFSWILESA